MENKIVENNIDNIFDSIKDFKGIGSEAKLIRDVVDIRTWLEEDFYSGPSSHQIYPYWKDAIVKVFSSPERINEVILGGCFIGDTKVPLLDGTVRTMKELSEEYGLEKPFWVYSVDSDGNVVPGKAKNARKTGVNKEVWKVTLDNGQELFCTPDHKFLTADLRYIQAKDLTPDISLYPSYIRLNKYDGRPEVYDLGTKRNGRWKKVHRLVGESIFEGLRSNEVVHHIDENKLNNTPENLMRMSKSSHVSLHNYKRMSQERYKDISRSNFKLYNESDLYKERREAQIKKSTEALKAQHNNPKRIEAVRKALVIRNKDEKMKSKMRETKSINWFKKWNIPRNYDELDKLFNKYSYTKYCSKIIGVKATSLFVNLQYLGWEDLAYKYGYKNHKIISVEFSHYEDVYDFEVEEYHNFMLYNTCTVHNSIGTGKTTIACYMIAYRLYELSCYYPPQALYNLMNNSKILFAYFNINKELASQVGFSQIRDLIDSIPYFQNIFRRNEKINSVLEWPDSHIYMKSASSSNDVIGMNLISFFVDEANFFKGDGNGTKGTSTNDAQSKAKVLYNSVRARGKSRFVVNNEDFTFNVLVSSSMYDSSFTAERIQDSIGDPHVMVFEPKIWEVKNVDTYSKERFVVFSGNELIDPVICKSVADVNYIRVHYKLKESKKKTPNEAIKDIKDYDIKKRFIEVPENFRKEFEGNIIQALQDIAGVPVSATGKLFSNRDCYARALTDEESPFIQDQIIISTGANTTIQDYFKEKWKPKDITKKRFIHFDQATTGDSYGAAQCYIDSITYDEFNLPKVNIKFDWMIRINPPKPPHKIDLAKVRSIIPWQEKNFGISYGMISYDSFQSAEAIQDLEKSGYPVRLNSVDRTDKDYLNLTELYYQGRIHHYRNEWYEKELFNLNWYRAQKKIDHPPVSEGGCLRGNTKIRLLNGTSVEIKDLLNKKEFWLYGSLSDGTIVPTKGRNCRVTRYVDKLFRITLDNGEVIEVTENHPFMLRDGSYKKADELTIGISLMPLYTKVNGNYELILNNKTGRWNFTHIYTYKWFNNDYDRFKVIHHYDINPRNNEPDNLRQLTRPEHMKIHKEILCRLSAEARKDNEEYIEKQRKAHYKVVYGRDYKVQDISFKDYKPFSPSDEDKYFRYKSKYLRKKERQIKPKYHGFSDYNLSEEARIKNKRNAIKLNTEYWNKPENKEWQKTVGKQNLRKALNIRLNKEDNIWLDKVKNSNIDYSNFSIPDFMFEFGGSRNAVERRVLKLKGLYNHKISNIEVIYLDKPEPVYDITVDETSNFALSSGIFVHNSKDLADAVCGSVANALDYPAIEETQRENDINYFLDDVDMDPNKFKSDVDILLGSFNNMY